MGSLVLDQLTCQLVNINACQLCFITYVSFYLAHRLFDEIHDLHYGPMPHLCTLKCIIANPTVSTY